jgi:hypothetical protein
MAEFASFDWNGFGRALLDAVHEDGRGLAPAARDAGVTVTTISRATSGMRVGVEAVFALGFWAGVDPHRFYIEPMKTTACSRRPVKHAEVMHGQ